MSIWMSPCSAEWVDRFLNARREIMARLGVPAATLEHVESTSVPGMWAKPIVDVCLGVDDSITQEELRKRVRQLGYWEANVKFSPPRTLFIRTRDGKQVNLHVVPLNGEIWQRMILFRDWLRTHPDSAEKYSSLKRELVSSNAEDYQAYRAGKAPFINGLEAHAIEASRGANKSETPNIGMSLDAEYQDWWSPPSFPADEDGGAPNYIDEGGGHWEFVSPDGSWEYVPDPPNDGVEVEAGGDGPPTIRGIQR
ncbi:GrpB family protein [Pseudarthrobacter phenanthrenivorans]|uniref:GrpB family protein n=1 Tax=Pseudarthrobacter phenanthrenivorans TaxID=361575 RepID=UPI00344E2007